MKKSSKHSNKNSAPWIFLVFLFPLGLIATSITILQRRQQVGSPYTAGDQNISSERPKTCSEAMASASATASSLGTAITETRNGEMSPIAVNPFPFKEYIAFTLEGSEATSRFMDNDEAQRSITEDILQVCQSTTKVTFAVNQTDYIITWFRMPGNTIQKGICRDPNINDPYQQLPWGEYVCL